MGDWHQQQQCIAVSLGNQENHNAVIYSGLSSIQLDQEVWFGPAMVLCSRQNSDLQQIL